jgi:hypothetical protein
VEPHVNGNECNHGGAETRRRTEVAAWPACGRPENQRARGNRKRHGPGGPLVISRARSFDGAQRLRGHGMSRNRLVRSPLVFLERRGDIRRKLGASRCLRAFVVGFVWDTVMGIA